MKKYIITALIAIAAFSVKAQKLEKPVIDKISGDTTWLAKEQTLANPFTIPGHFLAGNIVKGKNYWAIYFHLRDGLDIHYYVSKGDKAIIKFADGKLLEILSIFNAHSSIIPYATPPVAESFLGFDLPEEAISALENGKISVIRIQTSKGDFDYDIKDSKSEIIKKQLELIAKK